MITLKQWMEVSNYRITEGSDYNAYGGAYALTSWNGHQDGYSLEIVFDQKTQTVYEAQACDYRNNRAYRLINPAHQQASRDDAAWDNTDWTDLEEDDDWIRKAQSIVAGRDYDTRITVPIDLADSELLTLMKLAHERDVTLNQLVEQALREAMGLAL